MTFDCSILENSSRKGLYRRIVFSAPEIAAKAAPGQFVHIRIPGLRDRILRRPFSICGYDPKTGNVTVVYKVVGAGTAELAEMLPGQACNIMGPLGKGYPMPSGEETPILVAGGYGSAAMLMGDYTLMRQGQVKVTWLTEGAQLFLEDDVLTSGSGGLIPQGIVIGSVASIQSEAGGQTEYGIINPAVDLDTLVQVYIIKEFDVVE